MNTPITAGLSAVMPHATAVPIAAVPIAAVPIAAMLGASARAG